MKLSKRIVALLLALVMVVGLMPAAFAEGEADVADSELVKLEVGQTYSFSATDANESGEIRFEFTPAESATYVVTPDVLDFYVDCMEIGIPSNTFVSGGWFDRGTPERYFNLEKDKTYWIIFRNLGSVSGTFTFEAAASVVDMTLLKEPDTTTFFANMLSGFDTSIMVGAEIEMTLSDGTKEIARLSEGPNYRGGNFYFVAPTEAEPKAKITYGDFSVEYDVTIDSNIVESIRWANEAPIKLEENSDGYLHLGADGEFFFYYTSDAEEKIAVEATFADGTTRVFTEGGSILHGNRVMVNIQEQLATPWVLGQNTVTVEFCGLTCEAVVEIVEFAGVTEMKLIKAPEVTTVFANVYANPYRMLNGAEVEMIYADGTKETVTLTNQSLDFDGGYFDYAPPAAGETEAKIVYGNIEVAYPVTVDTNVVTSIRQANPDAIKLTEEVDGHISINYETGEEYFYYEIRYADAELEVEATFADGSKKIVMLGDELYGNSIEYGNSQIEKAWTVGVNTFEIRFCNLTCEGYAEVVERVYATEMKLVKAPDMTAVFADVYPNHIYQVLKGAQVEITLSDGTKETVSIDYTLEYNDMYFDFVPPAAGETEATITYDGLEVKYPITVDTNTVKSIRGLNTEAIELAEGIDGFENWGIDGEFFQYDVGYVGEDINFEVTFADGTTKTLGYRDNIYGNDVVFEDNQWENPWGLGENKAIFSLCGKTCEVVFKVVEYVGATEMKLIKSPTITTLFADVYPGYEVMYGAELEMIYADGTKEIVKLNEYDDLTYNKQMFDFVPPAEGDTVAKITYGSLEVFYPVTVDTNTVESIKVLNGDKIVLIENAYGGIDTSVDGKEFFWYNIYQPLFESIKIEATLADGTKKVLGVNDKLNGNTLHIGDYVQYETPWTVGSDNKVIVELCGKTCETNVTIVENPVAKIEVLAGIDAPIFGDSNYGETLATGEFKVEDFWGTDHFVGASIKITYTDGTVKTVTSKDFEYITYESGYRDSYLDGYWIYAYISDDSFESWTLAAPDTFEAVISYMGFDVETTLTISKPKVEIKEDNATVTDKFVDDAINDAINSAVGGETGGDSGNTGDTGDSGANEDTSAFEGNTVVLDVSASVPPTSDSGETVAPVTTVTLPTAAVNTIVANKKTDNLAVKLPEATVQISGNALAAIADQVEGEDMSLKVTAGSAEVLTEKQTEALEKAGAADAKEVVVISASIISAGKEVHDFKGGEVTISVPYTLPEGVSADEVAVIYVSDDGTSEVMKSEYRNGKIYITTNHFSDFVITKVEKAPETNTPETENKPGQAPDTGNDSNIAVWCLLLVASVAAAALLITKKRKDS